VAVVVLCVNGECIRSIWMCVCVCVSLCARVCVWVRERERERGHSVCEKA